MATDPSQIGTDNSPVQSYPGQADQSYGFIPAFKVQTGNMRGVQTVGYGSVKLDGANNRITIGKSKSSLILGDQNSITKSFGLSVSDATTPRLLAGEYPDGSIKIKLSQAGYDVSTATDNQLIWSSDFNMFKIVQSGTVTLSPPASWTNGQVIRATVFHGLLTAPSFQVYATNPALGASYISSGLSNLPSSIYFPSAGGGCVLISQSAVDDTNLYIDLVNMTGLTATGLDGFVWTYKYYILRETAS